MRDRYIIFHAKILAIAMVLVLFSACVKEDDGMDLSSQVSLKASIGPVLSSTYTKGVGEISSGYNQSLTIGLARVDGASTNFDNATGPLEAEMGAPSAQNMGLRDIAFQTFQGFPDGTTPVNYVGWYPSGSNFIKEGGKNTVKFAIPTDASTDILYSNIASGTRQNGFNTLVFSHALVKYSFKAYAMEVNGGDDVDDVWGTPVKVELVEMPNACVLTLPSSADESVKVSYGGYQNATDQCTFYRYVTDIDLQEGISNAVDLAYFLAPPPVNQSDPNNKILRIKVTTQKGNEQIVESQTLSVASDFQPGKHYQIYLRFTTHGTINAEVKVEDWQTGGFVGVESNAGIYYDLSESHTANSYIISSANRYCFNATVRGNGYTGVAGIPGAPADVYKVGDPVSAEIIWTDLVSEDKEDFDPYFSLVSKVEEGKVFFNVKTMKEGNVVVGVRDKSENLLWTWHLWLTDRPAEQGYKNGFAVQDRDLGATAYNPAGDQGTINGLYYQWGRPTPLPLDRTVYKPNYDTNGKWTYNEEVHFESSGESANMVGRVTAPTRYYNVTATASEGDLTKSLWGWRAETDEYAKTIYDPCPPGYRVPSIKLWRDLYIHNAEAADNAIKFHIDGNETVVYYPMNGFYTELGKLGSQNGAYMWAATFDPAAIKPYGLDFIKGANNTISAMQLVTEPSNHAMPVRCVSRMSKAHVTDLSDYQTANSYMVHKDGYYKFKATVRGNGIGKLVSPGATSTIDLTEQLQSVDMKNQLVKVEPLWWKPAAGTAVTAPAFILQNDGKPDDEGYVTFQLETFNEGNLVLAGYDASDKIIWSWHLWFTDEPEMMKSNSFVLMDRNLGATYAPASTTAPTGDQLSETLGFYYQWGRKDPFLEKNAVVYKYDSGTKTYSQSSSAFSTESAIERKTVENAVQHPMTYHLASQWRVYNPTDVDLVYQYGSGIYVYIIDQDNISQNQCYSNMVYPDSRKSLWGYSAAQGYGVTTTKTMYDPCPPGYVVAHYLVWTNTERDDKNNLYYTGLDSGFIEHKLTTFDGGLFLNNGLPEGDVRYSLFDSAWFPYTGYLSPTTTVKVQPGVGVFHTSTPAGNGSRSIAYDFKKSGQVINGNIVGMPSSAAYPVRCQKE